ncbi:hypothetical protein J4407_00800 [Candidatus Pacearchaeota archaeon]|nr:hypothetical protein [Candidatus Pacearchaeota archaeon]
MARKQSGMVLNFILWLTGVLVSLAVGFGLVDGVLTVRWIPLILTQIVGWVVVITTVVGAIMAIVNK